ncbi:tRNA (adenosine(37)-N6)-threonylcarbamoyltransferase complex dimerization subunit type 1 TsaB [Nitrincola sp.]|uniref:tRNA (adenosine(37)-N6)-threonylcarbamoyltransferase complex dimerization subunit type 1 TsaB n=1 Tax=Nitrincola sp. TaxID=1926584 RepID=UPI003A91B983
MTRILALDTSTDACSVALMDGQSVREDFRIEPRRHTHLLLPMVDAMLADSGLRVQDLDAIAFGRGPGSFAGIRIATGAAQGLALAADLPLIPVSTLSALALDATDRYPEAVVLAALDARMDEVYWSVCARNGDGIQVLQAESVSSPAAVRLNEFESVLVAVGSGLRYVEQMPPESIRQFQQVDSECYPHAASMLKLAMIELQAGAVMAPEDAQPVYLRDQVAWKKKDQ